MSSLTERLTARFDNDPEAANRLIAIAGELAVKLLLALLILAVTAWMAGLMSRLIRNAVGRYSQHHSGDTTLSAFMGSIVRYGVWIVGLIAVFQQIGVQTTSILTVLGAASLAIGLALQGALSNVAAGVMLLFLRPYRVGDTVELSGREGRVKKLDLFTTELTAFDGLLLVIPNSKVLGEMMINFSASGKRRMTLDFGIDYEDDVDRALEVLLRCAGEDERVLHDPAPWAKVTALNDSSVQVTLRAWTDADSVIDAKYDMIRRVKKAFEEADGVSFPYPHQVEMSRSEARGGKPVVYPLVYPPTREMAGIEEAPPETGTTPPKLPSATDANDLD